MAKDKDKDQKKEQKQFEEMQKQMQSMFSGVSFSPFTDEITPNDSKNDDDDDDREEEEINEILEKIRSFHLKPKEIRDYLDRFVIRQHEAKKVLSVAICDHYNHVRQCLESEQIRDTDYMKQNIIVLGPTGVGKTYLMKCIAKLIGVPFVKADATKFSETGYVGNDVEDMVRDLYKQADKNTELAEYGIIYIDEIDKIASSGNQNGGKDVSGRGVQTNLLKLMEDTEVNIQGQNDMAGQMEMMMSMMNGGDTKTKKRTISTKHILFIVSGAFGQLAEQIKRRIKGAKISFVNSQENDENDNQFLKNVSTEDLVKYGFEPEFIGRLPVRVACEELSANDLEEILMSSEGSILRQYVNDFLGYDINLEVTRDATREIAERAHLEKTGARGLMTVLEGIFRNYKFELPSTSIESFIINKQAIDSPENTLSNLLEKHKDSETELMEKEIQLFAERFLETHKIQIVFNKTAINKLIDSCKQSGKTIKGLCEQKFKDLHFGLKLIQAGEENFEFTINGKLIDNTDSELSNLVVKKFRK